MQWPCINEKKQKKKKNYKDSGTIFLSKAEVCVAEIVICFDVIIARTIHSLWCEVVADVLSFLQGL